MPNFYVAAGRHLDDGNLLYCHNRPVNATHLWAYGAECVLKAIAHKQGHFQLVKDKPDSNFGFHLNHHNTDLLSIYNATQSGPNTLLAPNSAFVGWDVSARYEDGTQLQAIDLYVKDAETFRKLLARALVEGLLP